jgi:hypothetical protein
VWILTVLKSYVIGKFVARKVEELVSRAKAILSGHDHSKAALWQAYVAIEYAILDLKLRHDLQGIPGPPRLTRKVTADLPMARSLLEKIDVGSDEKKLLYDLRACRDVLKSLVAGYDRRSTTS